MKLICPSCGAVGSAETWAGDDNCRNTLLVVSRLPHPLPASVLGYISLFRPGKRSLTWAKALRLVSEIEQLVSKGYVHVRGQVDRNCTPGMWARGMEQMLEQRAMLRLPMASHGYLTKIVWDLADQQDRDQEYGKKQQPGQTDSVPQPVKSAGDPLAAAKKRWDEEHGFNPVKPALKDVGSIVKGMD